VPPDWRDVDQRVGRRRRRARGSVGPGSLSPRAEGARRDRAGARARTGGRMIIALAFALLFALQTPAQQAAPPPPTAAGLRATIRLNIARVDVPSNAPASPLGNVGPLIAQLLTPDGPVEI